MNWSKLIDVLGDGLFYTAYCAERDARLLLLRELKQANLRAEIAEEKLAEMKRERPLWAVRPPTFGN